MVYKTFGSAIACHGTAIYPSSLLLWMALPLLLFHGHVMSLPLNSYHGRPGIALVALPPLSSLPGHLI